jgi:tRNA G10  N-methylase Trm11
MKTFFILGRNPKLSRLEVIEFLKARGRKHKEILFENNILIIETNKDEKFNIQEFGGVMFLGEILLEAKQDKFKEYIEKNEIIPDDKFSYSVFGNLEIDLIKNKFKERKKRSVLKHGGKKIKFQDGHAENLAKSDYYLLYTEKNNIIYFGRVNQEYDNSGVKKRDMEKPIRREYLAISPRLSKILINLSGAKPYDLMLDPFCGVGGILQEALLKRINVYGIDKDKKAILDCEKNLEWMKKEFGYEARYTIKNMDSKKTPDMQFNAVATETPLAKILKKKPNKKEAQDIIQNFELFIVPILRRLKKVKKENSRIAITFPVVLDNHVDIHKVARKSELEVYIDAINESRSDQFISRDVVVFR